jgi:hypothetical protein
VVTAASIAAPAVVVSTAVLISAFAAALLTAGTSEEGRAGETDVVGTSNRLFPMEAGTGN